MVLNPVESRLQALEAEVARLRGYVASAFLSLKEVCARYGCSRSTLYRRLKEKTLPAPVRCPRRAWRLADLIQAEEAGRLPKPN